MPAYRLKGIHMLQKILFLILLSVLALVGLSELAWGLNKLWHMFTYIDRLLHVIFSGSTLGSLIRKTIALMLIPSLITGIPIGLYFLISRKISEHFYSALLIVWSLTAASVALHYV